MIRDFSGEPTTPRRLAQDFIMDGLATTLGYWQERYAAQLDQMTDRERAIVEAQLRKQAQRVATLLGFEEPWSG